MTPVRLFAAAAEAAGADQLEAAGATVGEVKAHLVERFDDDFARILRQCSVMANGQRCNDDAAVPDSGFLDILPPFAGG
ncbi:MoaD/ThiS family protein [Demequina sediminicola]|uniref:MoaD/ThiS family protein n=1 Tax=Demequina sediminicola TaxID=1095026 RepID=UPI000783B4CA|nr:MoaD/ThiS family protein [Demequina sediminicola]